MSRFRIPAALVAMALLAPALAFGQSAIRYVAFGDSITEGFGDTAPPLGTAGAGYPPRLQAKLQAAGINAVVVNQGHGGETTPEGLERLASALSGTSTGDVLLLMEGTNDISQGISLDTTRYHLGEMARRAEARGLTVVQATVIPRTPSARFDPQNVLTLELNQNIRDMAGRRGRDLADVYEVFLSRSDRFSTLYYAAYDPVGHPNPAGYELIAQTFFEVLTDVDKVPPVLGLTTPPHNAQRVPAATSIEVDVWDFGAGIDIANTDLLVNGVDVNVTPSGDQRRVRLSYQPPEPLRGVVRIGLRARDLASPPNTVNRDMARFVIAGTTFLKGDIDEDGRVDGDDLVRLAILFGARSGQIRFNALADLNNDEVIDGLDLAMLASNFGRSSF